MCNDPCKVHVLLIIFHQLKSLIKHMPTCSVPGHLFIHQFPSQKLRGLLCLLKDGSEIMPTCSGKNNPPHH